MAKFDIESFRDYWINLIKNNLQAKLDEIMTEKGDALKLDNFSDGQWTNDLNNKVMNSDCFVLYSLIINALATNGQESSIEITLTIEVVFSNQEGGVPVENKILRYTRAIKEIVLANSQENENISDIEATELAPVDIRTSLESQIIKTGAVEIKGVITT